MLWIKKIFKFTKSDSELEDLLTEQAIEENKAELNDLINSSDLPVTVINYLYIDNGEDEPTSSINVLVPEFHCKMVPPIDSIIWVEDNNEILRPFKVIRYDFIENGSDIDRIRVYVVVEVATIADIIPNPKFKHN